VSAENLGVVIAHDDRAVTEQITGILEATPGMFVAAISLEAARAGHVVVAGGEALITARRVANPLVALAGEDPVRAARAALAAGARELIRWPQEADRLPAAIARAAAGSNDVKGDGAAIAVAGARGGVGTTTVVAQLAAAIPDAIVIDLDVGSAGQGLFAAPGEIRRLHDLFQGDDVSVDAIETALVPHVGHSRALHVARGASELSVSRVNSLLRAARACASATVIDCARGVSLAAARAAEMADHRIIVAADDVSSIRGVRTLIDRAFGDARIVLWRARRRGISLRDVTAALGRAPAAIVHTDRRIPRATDLGTLPSRVPDPIARLARELAAAR
jgi:pilus assembly protein CpaE